MGKSNEPFNDAVNKLNIILITAFIKLKKIIRIFVRISGL